MNAARRALGIGEQAVRLRPGDPRARLEVAREHFQVALIAGGNGWSGSTREITAAIDHDRRVLAILADVPGGEDAPVRRGAAFAQLLLAFHLQRARAFGESSQVFDGLLASERTHPALNPTQRQIAHNWRANKFERAGDQRRAPDEYEVTLRLAQPLADADPQNGICVSPLNYKPERIIGQSCSAKTPNPIVFSIGNKEFTDTDYRGGGAFPIVFTRSYNSMASSRWRFSYTQHIEVP